MRVRTKIGNQSVEVNTQKRTVYITTIRQHGEVVSEGYAVVNPKDPDDPKKGFEISLSRAVGEYLQERTARPGDAGALRTDHVASAIKRAFVEKARRAFKTRMDRLKMLGEKLAQRGTSFSLLNIPTHRMSPTGRLSTLPAILDIPQRWPWDVPFIEGGSPRVTRYSRPQNPDEFPQAHVSEIADYEPEPIKYVRRDRTAQPPPPLTPVIPPVVQNGLDTLRKEIDASNPLQADTKLVFFKFNPPGGQFYPVSAILRHWPLVFRKSN